MACALLFYSTHYLVIASFVSEIAFSFYYFYFYWVGYCSQYIDYDKGFESRQGLKTFLFPRTSRLPLGPNKPPTQQVRRLFPQR
jgi:hypothetical protein